MIFSDIRTKKRYENLIIEDYGVTNQVTLWKMDQNSGGCKDDKNPHPVDIDNPNLNTVGILTNVYEWQARQGAEQALHLVLARAEPIISMLKKYLFCY